MACSVISFDIMWAAVGPPLFAFGWKGLYRAILPRVPYKFTLGWAFGAIATTVAYVAGSEWLPAIICGANAVLAIALWWWNRRRRKRSPKLAGAKSRARLAAIVRKSREASKPRPVLRPVPGGAR